MKKETMAVIKILTAACDWGGDRADISGNFAAERSGEGSEKEGMIRCEKFV